MPRFLFILILTGISISTFYSCKTECGIPPPVPLIEVKENLKEGDYVVLEARGSDEHTYLWQGPNQTFHDERVWELGTIQRVNEGYYTIDVEDGKCDPITNYKYIEVSPLPLPCLPSEPSVVVSNSTTFSFSNVQVDNIIDTLTGYFRILITANEGDIVIRFTQDEIPYYDRSYGMRGREGYSPLDVVDIELNLKSTGGTYISNALGYLYIRDQGNYDFDIYLCDLPLFGEGEIIYVTLFQECNIQ